jgi:hypothetical protein
MLFLKTKRKKEKILLIKQYKIVQNVMYGGGGDYNILWNT